MDKWRELRGKFIFLLVTILILVLVASVKLPSTYKLIPNPRRDPSRCRMKTSEDTITPLHQTKHMLVSAYMDQRVKKWDVRIIAIFRRDSIQPLHCRFCCGDHISSTNTPANILQHADNFGFPYVTTDVLCEIPRNCQATHVALMRDKDTVNQTFLPIRNQRTRGSEAEHFDFNFTVCISNLFGNYNNVLQYAQTLEMYRSVTLLDKYTRGEHIHSNNHEERLCLDTVRRKSEHYKPHKFMIYCRATVLGSNILYSCCCLG